VRFLRIRASRLLCGDIAVLFSRIASGFSDAQDSFRRALGLKRLPPWWRDASALRCAAYQPRWHRVVGAALSGNNAIAAVDGHLTHAWHRGTNGAHRRISDISIDVRRRSALGLTLNTGARRFPPHVARIMCFHRGHGFASWLNAFWFTFRARAYCALRIASRACFPRAVCAAAAALARRASATGDQKRSSRRQAKTSAKIKAGGA